MATQIEYPIEGRWHVDGKDKPAVFGTLTCEENEGLRLVVKIPKDETLADQLAKMAAPFNPFESPRVRTIIGFDRKNQPLILYRCAELRGSYPAGLSEVCFSVQCGVSHTDAENWESLTGRHFSFRYSLLHTWVNRPAIVGLEDPCDIGFSAKRPEDIVVPLQTGLTLTLGASLSGHHGRTGASLSEDSWLQLDFDEAQPVSRTTGEVAYQLRLLLSLLTGERINLDAADFSTESSKTLYSQPCSILRNYDKTKVRRDRSYYHLRSTLKDMQGRFAEVVSKWMEMHRDADMGQVLALYSSLMVHDFHISAEFVFLAQALEAYHASCGRYEQLQEPKHDVKVRCNRIRDALSPEDAEWLKEKLAFSNNKTFHQRLLELIGDAPPEARTIIPDTEAFVAGVKHNRNSYTHRYGKASHKKRLPEGTDLWRLSHQMWHLLELLLLRDLGLQHLGGKIVHSYLDHHIL